MLLSGIDLFGDNQTNTVDQCVLVCQQILVCVEIKLNPSAKIGYKIEKASFDVRF